MSRRPIVLMMTLASVLAALALGHRGVGVRCPAHRHEGARARNIERPSPTSSPGRRRFSARGSRSTRSSTSPGHSADHRRVALGHACRRHPRGEIPGGHRVGRRPAGMHRTPASRPCPSPNGRALEEYEHTFNVRQMTGDIYPGSGYGLNTPTISGALDGIQGTLSSRRQNGLPLSEGAREMDTGTYGYEATPLTSQVRGELRHARLRARRLGAGRASTPTRTASRKWSRRFDQNQYQLQAELLRHGAVDWVTRGVYFGDQRNYYEAEHRRQLPV